MFPFRSSHEVQTLQSSLLSFLENWERSELSAFFDLEQEKVGEIRDYRNFNAEIGFLRTRDLSHPKRELYP